MTSSPRFAAVAVIGGGSWGTALAQHLALKGLSVRLWVFEEDLAGEIASSRKNETYLPGILLEPSLTPSHSLEAVLTGSDLALFVTPSHVTRLVLKNALPWLPPEIPVVVASKGIETETLKTMSEVFEEELPRDQSSKASFLSGPSFAREVAAGLPTAVSLGCRHGATADAVQRLFSNSAFRVYTTPDVRGVELGGSLKNVIAIAAGISDGLGLGLNARSALITRGLAEMIRLGEALGADPRTFAGLSGLGDLVLTCTGDLSRNRTVGRELGAGKTIDAILGPMNMVAEGVKTSLATVRLARQSNVEMPIAEQIYSVLYEEKSPRSALEELMSRDLRPEVS
jgi:glycerol-3-phosphate dehydrogenase (NAD(P)+)